MPIAVLPTQLTPVKNTRIGYFTMRNIYNPIVPQPHACVSGFISRTVAELVIVASFPCQEKKGPWSTSACVLAAMAIGDHESRDSFRGPRELTVTTNNQLPKTPCAQLHTTAIHASKLLVIMTSRKTTTAKTKARSAKTPTQAVAAKKATAPAKKVVILGTVQTRGGHYQVLAPSAPTRHVSAADIDSAVRRVLAAR